MIALIFLVSCGLLALGYRFYGGYLSRRFEIDPSRPTPSRTMTDGVDYVPSRAPMLFGHHFSSIAGAGPIVGAILASSWFGWGPTLLWILVGAIFIGGLHDYGSLVVSIRHKARSVAEICRIYLSPVSYRFFLVFIWLALVYVLIVFVDMTAATFVSQTEADPHQGGTVATASVIYIILAIVFGLAIKKGLGLARGSMIFVPLVFAGLFVAHALPTDPTALRGLAPEGSFFFENPKYNWSAILLAYCFVASITPVWLLLQPRDYLSSFLLFGCLGFGGVGLVISGLFGKVSIEYEAFLGLHAAPLGYIFPALFITVACGAVSGFHSIVSSGTTAKQLPDEAAAKPIAYGGMLTESVLAIVALASVMILVDRPSGNPMVTFSQGIGTFMSALGLPAQWGTVFGLLAVSTFLLTTLDTCTRLARFILEEFFGARKPHWRYLSTLATLAPLFYFAFATFPDPLDSTKMTPAWQMIWPAFSTTNQLLAALALLVMVVWRRGKNKSYWFVLLPMLFMLATTVTSMVMLIRTHLSASNEAAVAPIGWINLAMLLMTLVLLVNTAVGWRRMGSYAVTDNVGEPEPKVVDGAA